MTPAFVSSRGVSHRDTPKNLTKKSTPHAMMAITTMFYDSEHETVVTMMAATSYPWGGVSSCRGWCATEGHTAEGRV